MSDSSLLSPSVSSLWRALPITPGVYIFKNKAGAVLYVGKAKNLKSRVSSYFQSPLRLGPKTAKLVSFISTIDHINVFSEIEALLLESRLIKKFKPPFNIASRDDKSPYYIHLSREIWPKPQINHEPVASLAGPFLNRYTPSRVLKQFRQITPYCLSPRPVRKPCLYSHLGLCNPCPGSPHASRVDYLKNIRRLKNLIMGHFSRVESQLNREMQDLSKELLFEKAATVKKQIEALSYLKSQPVSPQEFLVNPNLVEDSRLEALESLKKSLSALLLEQSPLNRIEVFDVAHLSGTSATAAMTVAVNGEINSKYFRHFTIKHAKTTSDVDMMAEVVARRLKNSDWPMPDLIVLDGGKPQLAAVLALSASHLVLPPLAALAKQFETLVIPVGKTYEEITLPKSHPGLLLLMRLRDEAHRFSRRLHHKHRSKNLTR